MPQEKLLPGLDRALDGADGARWFFRELVEPLCDSFDPALQARHDRLLTSVIGAVARQDAALGARLAARPPVGHRRGPVTLAPRPDLCVLPSRVTIGADVAVTATIMGVVRAAWPDTRVALVGSPVTLAPLLSGRRGVEIWDHPYPRHGSLRDRLSVWAEAADTVDAWTRRNAGASVLVLDPDSRITQLGLLPLTARSGATRHFPARGMPVTDRRNLTALAEDWARRATGGVPAPIGPRLVPSPDDLRRGAELVRALRRSPGHPVAVASLGVGGNVRKATGVDTEADMLARLSLRAAVVLDAGATAAETARATTVATAWAAATGRPFRHLRAGDHLTGEAPLVVLHRADLCAVAGLLARADLFVGYDSAFQHLAAAVGTPGVVVFVDPPSTTFVDRWRAPGTTALVVPRAGASSVDGPDGAGGMAVAVEQAVTGLLRARPAVPSAGR
jgi:hypothetical protein